MPNLDTIQVGGTDYGMEAQTLATNASIDGVAYSAVNGVSRYAVCTTAAGTSAKTVTITNTVTVSAGTTIRVKFTNGNTASNPTFNVNGLGAYPIVTGGINPAESGAWADGEVIDLCFDGANWQIINGAMATGTTAGRVKIDSTLSNAGEAADAKEAGDAIAAKQDQLTGAEGQYIQFDSNFEPQAVTPDATPTNGSANLAESGGIFAAIANLYPTVTIENVSVATFPDGADNIPVKSMTVAITPVQAAGTPTPENPLPISGWTGANIVVSPTLDAQDGTTYPVSWQTEAGTVYGGTLRDNGNGTWTLTVTHKNVVLDGSEIDWQLSRAGAATNCFSLAIADAYCPNRVYVQCISSHFNSPPSLPAADARANTIFFDKFGTDVELPSYLNIGASSDIGQTVEDFKTWLASNNVTVVYLLTTPQAYPLTAESVKTLLGDNNIFADTGDVLELVYRADVELYIAKKLAEV